MHAQSLTHSCLILCNPLDCSPPGSSAHGKFPDNTWVGSPFLLPGIFLTQGLNPHLLCLLHWQADSLPLCRQGSLGKHAKWLQSSLTLCSPTDCSPPGSSVHGILQASILEWVAMPFSRGSSWPRDRTNISYAFYVGRGVLYHSCHLGRPRAAYR